MELRQRLVLLLTILTAGASAREPLYHYSFFHNSRMPGHYFYTKVVGEGVKNIRGKLPVSETIFHTPGNALQLEYVNAANSKWQAMIFRQQIRGQDHFAPPRFLSFGCTKHLLQQVKKNFRRYSSSPKTALLASHLILL